MQENLEDDDDDDDSIISDIDISSDDETSTQKLIADERGNKLALYEGLVDKTRDIPLEKVGSEVDIYFRQGFNICQFHWNWRYSNILYLNFSGFVLCRGVLIIRWSVLAGGCKPTICISSTPMERCRPPFRNWLITDKGKTKDSKFFSNSVKSIWWVKFLLINITSLLFDKWVETCVRPKEGLTKAMLEMYMQDGGTLGEVLQALLQLQCLDILEAIRPKVEKFLEERDRYKDTTTSPSSQR